MWAEIPNLRPISSLSPAQPTGPFYRCSPVNVSTIIPGPICQPLSTSAMIPHSPCIWAHLLASVPARDYALPPPRCRSPGQAHLPGLFKSPKTLGRGTPSRTTVENPSRRHCLLRLRPKPSVLAIAVLVSPIASRRHLRGRLDALIPNLPSPSSERRHGAVAS